MDEYSLNITKSEKFHIFNLKILLKETCLNDSRVYFAVSRLIGSSLNEVFLGEGEKGERGPSQYCCLSQYHINCYHVSTLESVEKTPCVSWLQAVFIADVKNVLATKFHYRTHVLYPVLGFE